MALLRKLRTPQAFAALTLVTLGLMWIIVPSGAVVRLTGSGLGCPDWPTCDGGVVPEAAGHAWIEYTNRLLSGVVGVVAVLDLDRRPAHAGRARRPAPLVAGARARRAPPRSPSARSPWRPGCTRWPSGRTSCCRWSPWRSPCCWPSPRATGARAPSAGWDLRRGPLAIAVAVAAGVVLVTGVVVTAAGPHSGDDDVIRRWGDLVLAAEVHVRAAIAFTALAVVLVAWVARERGVDRVTGRLFLAALPLVALQIGLGEYQYRNGLPWQVVVFHVTVAALVWAVIVGAAAGVVRPLRAPVYGRREATRWQGTQRTESGSAVSRPSGISPPQSTQIP